MSENIKILAKNKRAYHEFFIEDKYEAGIVLKGTEVKSIRQGHFNFKDAYVKIRNGECWLIGFHISHYKNAGYAVHDPDAARKLLLNKMEIRRLQKKLEQQGFTVVPLMVYLKRGLVKIEIGLAKGKKLYDKRHDIRDRDMNREMERAGKKINY
jgi:SsrA-binding protein